MILQKLLTCSVFVLFFFLSSCSTNQKELENKLALGNEQMRTGEFHNAIRTYREILKNDSDNKDAINNLGIVYAAAGEYDLSEQTFKQALENDPTNTQVIFNLGQLYKTTKKHVLAEKFLLDASKDEDFFDRPKVMYQLGDLYYTTGNKEKAINAFHRTVRLGGDVCPAYMMLAKIHRSMGQYKEAINNLKQATGGVCVRDRNAMLFMADTYREMGNTKASLAILTKIVKLFSGESVAKVAQKRITDLQAK